jgi:hypothetical protein
MRTRCIDTYGHRTPRRPSPILPPSPIHPACRGAAAALARSHERSGAPLGAYDAFDRGTVTHLANMQRMGCPVLIFTESATREALAIQPILGPE